MQHDPGSERGLEELAVGRGHRVPLEGVEIGGEEAGLVYTRAKRTRLLLDDLGAELHLPKGFDGLTLVVVVEAHGLDQGELVRLWWGNYVFDEPLPMSQSNDVIRFGSLARGTGRAEEACYPVIAWVAVEGTKKGVSELGSGAPAVV